MSKKATIEVSGRIKWFDPRKGFGFLVCDGIEGDVLIHFSVLREHGRRVLTEGAELVVEAFLGERGFHTEKVISIDMRHALPPRQPSHSAKSTKQTLGEAGPFELATVKWFDELRGYGFLVRGEADVFVHAATIRAAQLPFPEKGEELEARIATGEKGLIAVEVRAHAEQALAA